MEIGDEGVVQVVLVVHLGLKSVWQVLDSVCFPSRSTILKG